MMIFHLGILVDVILEVVIFSDHRLGNNVIKLDGNRWEQRCFGGLCDPRQFGGLLVILHRVSQGVALVGL